MTPSVELQIHLVGIFCFDDTVYNKANSQCILMSLSGRMLDYEMGGGVSGPKRELHVIFTKLPFQ